MSMGDAWRRASKDRVARVHPQHKNTCLNWEIVENSALHFEKSRCRISQNVGTSTSLTPDLTRSCNEKSQNGLYCWNSSKDNLNEMDCLMQQKEGETVESMQNRWWQAECKTCKQSVKRKEHSSWKSKVGKNKKEKLAGKSACQQWKRESRLRLSGSVNKQQ